MLFGLLSVADGYELLDLSFEDGGKCHESASIIFAHLSNPRVFDGDDLDLQASLYFLFVASFCDINCVLTFNQNAPRN